MRLFKRSKINLPTGITSTVAKSRFKLPQRLTWRHYVLAITGALLLAGGVVLLAATPSDTPAGPMDGNVALSLPISGTPFAASSFWNTPLPASTPTSPNNAAYSSDIAYDLCNYFPIQSSPTNPCVIPAYGGLNTSSYSAPLYVVPANQPLVSVTRACGGVATPNAAFDGSVAGGVPVPADAHAAVGTDGEIQIYQPSTDKYWDFWRFQKDASGNWDACWGGGMSNVSQSNGIFPNNLGATATSLPLLGGDVRIEELQAGEIDHVMGLELANNLSKTVLPANTPSAVSGISWPATRGDGTSTSPLAIPEGTRLRLPANLDLSQYDLSPVAKVIAVAAQKYGFVVNDTTNGLGIYMGDPTTYTAAGLPNPYISGPGVGGVGTTGLFQGVPQYLVLKNFPWNQLEALPFDYGEPGVTPPPDTTPPSVPSGVTATAANSTQVSLKWNTSTDNVGVTGYKVYRNGSSTALATVTAPTITYADTDVGPGAAYSYTVSAVDAAGNESAKSTAASATTGYPMDGNVALSLPQSGTPFAANSFWNTLLPTSTPTNPNNSAYLNEIADNLCQETTAAAQPTPSCPNSTYYGYLNTQNYSAPLYVVPGNQPLVSVAEAPPSLCNGPTISTNFVNTVLNRGVPVPADAHAAGGTDAHITIYQPSTNTYWEFWRFQKDSSGNWEACYGGVITNVSQSSGIFPNKLGGDATSLALLGADPRIDELQAGQINHAIGITVGDVASADLGNNTIPANTPGATNGFSWPATRTDGTSINPLAIPEGQRFRLPANTDLSKLSPVAKTIAIAAEKYGFVVIDSSPQPSLTIKIGDPTTYTAAGLLNPYITGLGVGGVDDGNTGLFAGVSQTSIMQNFPWGQLQALPFNYGQPGTTPPTVPTSLHSTATTDTSISLAWTASTDTGGSGLAGYHVYRNGTLVASPSSASYTDTGLTQHTSYTYTVSAYDNAANGSAASSSLAVTTRYEGDFTGDGAVNILDLSIFLSNYGKNYAPAEFDDHTTVDLQDLSILLSNYGK